MGSCDSEPLTREGGDEEYENSLSSMATAQAGLPGKPDTRPSPTQDISVIRGTVPTVPGCQVGECFGGKS